MPIRTQNLGYPRIGEKRELKRATEGYWKGKRTLEGLLTTAAELRRRNWRTQREAGIDWIPSNDFSFYDQVLDHCCLVGAVPPRFGWDGETVSLDTYFTMARGIPPSGSHQRIEATRPMEMTKWFDTNYHYIVPELADGQEFRIGSTKPFDEFREAMVQGIKTKPVLLGPLSFLLLGKCEDSSLDVLSLLDGLLPVYAEILGTLRELGAEWVQMDEPALVLDLCRRRQVAFGEAYAALGQAAGGLKLMLATYFGDLRENLDLALALPVQGLHVDATRGGEEWGALLDKLPPAMTLSAGIVDGRNVWKNHFARSLEKLTEAREALGEERLMVGPSCSLLHSPITLAHEGQLDNELKSWLSFADEKLAEMVDLASLAALPEPQTDPRFGANAEAIADRKKSARIHVPAVKRRSASLSARDARRQHPFAARRTVQRRALKLPSFPTTTIGSYPQTKEIRARRADFRKGRISREAYERFLEEETRKVVRLQEEVGLDVLVHGEFERNDMVEYFGEQLEGVTFTGNGWVQSYGSRYVKPPIIFGDVHRPSPMTVRWSTFAQGLTERPVKGMLTGPVTIVQWSFVRDDQPESETAKQIALAVRDEVLDLERAGLRVIQIDEPALREGLPLRRADWQAYLDWAVQAFRIASSGVSDGTQIHTHMCYAEFNDIIEAIAALDADVISIEAARSRMELLTAFQDFNYPNEIGPGVWDIHSPRVPGVEEIVELLEKAAAVLPPERLWANPDCGLKTRDYEEVVPALKHMVSAAKRMRRTVPVPA